MTVTPVSWKDFEAAVPELAGTVRARFEHSLHHVLATIRADGSPRVSGTEVTYRKGILTLGSMPGARKATDLSRDPRCAIHANPGDGTMDGGDAKLACVAVEITDSAEVNRLMEERPGPPGPFHLFELLITEAVVTGIHPDGDRLVIQVWRPDSGERIFERA